MKGPLEPVNTSGYRRGGKRRTGDWMSKQEKKGKGEDEEEVRERRRRKRSADATRLCDFADWNSRGFSDCGGESGIISIIIIVYPKSYFLGGTY